MLHEKSVLKNILTKDLTLLKKIINSLPDKPGVYQFFDNHNEILYVGKAKSLKKRVSSYFTKEKHESGKTALLVRKTKNIKFIIVDTELEALLLENTLIKKHQPRYNVLLKDDKTYPWICVKNERFPRVFPTRNIVNDGSGDIQIRAVTEDVRIEDSGSGDVNISDVSGSVRR